MSAHFQKGWRGTGLYSVCSPNTNICHDFTGCDEMGGYFAIEADTMIDIVRVT